MTLLQQHRYCVVYFLLWSSSTGRNHPGLVSGWLPSPVATQQQPRTVTRSIPGHHHPKRKEPRDRSVSRSSRSCLYRDVSGGGGDDPIGNDDEHNGMEFFDDFDFVVGDNAAGEQPPPEYDSSPPASVSVSTLQQRFQKIALTEQVTRQQISDNWKEGYWGVWGCSLDPYNVDDDTVHKTVVTSVRKLQSSDRGDDDDGATLLVVGRSDGSICWLQMETLSAPSSDSSDNDATSSIETRSVTTYFENKLVAKSTDDGGMVVGTSLQRQERDGDSDDTTKDNPDKRSFPAAAAAAVSPFEILAQIQTAPASNDSGTDGASAAILDILPLPSARMVWTIARGTPTAIQGWNLGPDPDTGFLVPIGNGSSSPSSQTDIEPIHTSPIVAMKVVPNGPDDRLDQAGTVWVASVSNNGQVVVWEVTPGNGGSPSSIRIRLDVNLLQQQREEEHYDENESILSMDVDDQYLYLGSSGGRIYIFDLAELREHDSASTDAGPEPSLPLLKSFVGFTSRDPGVSTLLAAGPGSLGANHGKNSNNNNNNGNRPPTKSLIAGNMVGELKQWELIPAGKGRLEYWPRMASQKLPGGKPHVYETRDHSYHHDEGEGSFSPAIRGLLCLQQVLLAATDHDLTVWDSATGKALYDMQGLDFAGSTPSDPSTSSDAHHRPNLIAVNDSVLVTNGMENFVCVHDFAMDRVTSENVQDFLERDDGGSIDDEEGSSVDPGTNSGEDW